MPCIIPEQLVTENKVENPLVYDSKGCISDLSVNTIEEGVQCRRVKDDNDEGQHILYVLNIKAYATQIGKGNVVIKDPIEYQKSSSQTEPSNIVQKETKNIPTENTDVESEDEGKGGRKDVGFDCRRRSMDQLDVEASSEECPDTQPKRKQKKKRRARKRKEERDRSIVVHKCMQPPDPSESYIEFCRISDEVMMKVQVFRDNGRWGEFDDALERMSHDYSSPEGKIIILLEKSMAACYQNKLPESEDIIKIAIRDAQTTENSSSLIARALYYLSGVYRRMPYNCTGAADSCVDKAKQSLHNTGLTLDTTFADYEQGSVQMDFLATVPRNSKKLKALKEEAKTCLKKCIDGSVKLEQDTTTKRYIKKHHFAYIKIAMLDLDCRTAAGRNKEISVADIQEAKDCLDTLKNRYWNGIAQGEQVQYLLAMSDLSWRQNDLVKAKSFALKALSMATTFGFKTEIKPAMDRLERIQVKLQKLSGSQLEGQSGVLDDVRSGAHLSDSHFGDVSSGESDSLCSLSFWAK